MKTGTYEPRLSGCTRCKRLTLAESEELRQEAGVLRAENGRLIRERDQQHNRLLERNRENDLLVGQLNSAIHSAIELVNQRDVLRARLRPWWAKAWERVTGKGEKS